MKEEVKKRSANKTGGGALNGEVCMTKRSHNRAALWCGAKGGALYGENLLNSITWHNKEAETQTVRGDFLSHWRLTAVPQSKQNTITTTYRGQSCAD